MSPQDRWQRLRRETGRARERLGEIQRRLEERRSEPPRRGDLYTLPAIAEYPVEWLVVEEEEDPPRLLVVPADTLPLAGGGDVEVAAGELGGPLTLRCRHGKRVDPDVLARGRRTGWLSPEAVEGARVRCRAVEAGERVGSALEREVEEELEYQDWIEEVVVPAREALGREAPAREKGVPRRRPGLLGSWHHRPLVGLAPALAALFFLATVGLSLWVVGLRRQVADLSRPSLDTTDAEVVFGAGQRGGEAIRLSGSTRYLVLHLFIEEPVGAYGEYRIRIFDTHGKQLWTSEPLSGGAYSDYPALVIPRSALPPGESRLRLYGLREDGGEELVEEQVLEIEE